MNERIIFKNPDGTIGIIIPAPKSGLTIQQIAAKDVPPGLAYEFVQSNEIPADRTFRNAWRKDHGKPCHVDMPHAKEIHAERLRLKRIKHLDDLDVEYQRADEAGDQQKKKEIAAKKQVLRDVTKHPQLLNAQTPEDLKALDISDDGQIIAPSVQVEDPKPKTGKALKK